MNCRWTSALLMATVVAFCTTASADLIQYRKAVAGYSPIASWTFEDASSASGATLAGSTSAYDGTYGDNVTQVTGALGQGKAISFDGTADATVPNTSLPTGNGARTILGWINTTSTTEYGAIAVYGTTAGTGTNCAIYTRQSAVSGGNWGDSTYGGVCNDGKWHMFALTVTSTTTGHANWDMYVDGADVWADTQNLSTNTSLASAMTLGQGQYLNGYTGSLDELSVLNTTLSADAIHGLYAAAIATTPTPEPSTIVLALTSAIGLLAYAWRKRK
jgi:hypothetical protein